MVFTNGDANIILPKEKLWRNENLGKLTQTDNDWRKMNERICDSDTVLGSFVSIPNMLRQFSLILIILRNS